jgi:Cu+-exporting ATPase
MAFSLAINLSDTAQPEQRLLQAVLLAVTLAVAALTGQPLWQAVRTGLRQRRLGIEALFVSGMLGATAISLHSLWQGTGAVYFEVVAILLVTYALAANLKASSQTRLHAALQAAAPHTDRCRRVFASPGPPLPDRAGFAPIQPQPVPLTCPTDSWVPIESIQVGDWVRTEPGELLGIDGVVVQGQAYVNEATLTGEGFCVGRRVGDTVHAGSRCLDAPLVVRATCRGTQRQLDALLQSVLHGVGKKAQLQLWVDRVAGIFFPVVATVACSTAAFWAHRAGPTPAFLHGMAVLLVACPCALGFATPMGFWTAAVQLSRLGIHTRHSAAIERLAAVDALVFDKTGTLTEGTTQLLSLQVLPGSPHSRATLLAMAQAAQRLSDHPLAAAFVPRPQPPSAGNDPADAAADPLYAPHQVQLLPGLGLQVTLRSRLGPHTLTLGEPLKLASAAEQPAMQDLLETLPLTARPIGLFVDGQACGIAALAETPLPQVPALLQACAAQHLSCHLFSGDATARLAPFNIADAKGGLTPTAKVFEVQKLRQAGHRLAFVGDGVNDSAAMACCEVSFGIAQGAPLAVLAADFTLSQASLVHLPQAVAVARRAQRLVRTNLGFAAAYNTLGMAAAAAGLVHPVGAALLMLCASLTVTLRSMVFLQAPQVAFQLPEGSI